MTQKKFSQCLSIFDSYISEFYLRIYRFLFERLHLILNIKYDNIAPDYP